MSSNVLVVCVAVRGYQFLFRRNLASQRQYCARMGYRYCLINSVGQMQRWQIPWMKVALMEHALREKFAWVMCVDADCRLGTDLPRLESLRCFADKSVFMAPGFSGQVNSGVMIAREDASSRFFFRTVLANCERDVPGADWGENGHIAFFARHASQLHVLSRAWNNNTNPAQRDFIRHFCGGTRMEQSMYSNRLARWLFVWLRPRVKFSGCREGLKRTLRERLLYCLAMFPELHYSSKTTV